MRVLLTGICKFTRTAPIAGRRVWNKSTRSAQEIKSWQMADSAAYPMAVAWGSSSPAHASIAAHLAAIGQATISASQVGRILDAIEASGKAASTYVFFTADQGLAVGHHGLMGKQNLYEHFKSPLVLAGPGIPHGQSATLVYLFDLFPTICDLAEATTPAVIEGRSLLPSVQDRKTSVRDTMFCAYRDGQRMVRDERWKIIEYNAAGVRNTQLFDLVHDPDELHNLAADLQAHDQLARLRKLLATARQEYGDPIAPTVFGH